MTKIHIWKRFLPSDLKAIAETVAPKTRLRGNHDHHRGGEGDKGREGSLF